MKKVYIIIFWRNNFFPCFVDDSFFPPYTYNGKSFT